MRQNIIKTLLLLPALLFLSSCGNSKKLTSESKQQSETPRYSMKQELLTLRLSEIATQRPANFYAKTNAKYSDNKTNVSFKTSLIMRADSAVQANITYANIPIFNALVTPDNVTLVDRRNKCYREEQMAFLKTQFNVDFSHKNIEELFLGLPIAWEKEAEHQLLSDSDYTTNYVISQKTKKEQSNKDLLIRYYLGASSYNLNKVIIDSPADTTSITINYNNYELIDEYLIPKTIEINIKTARNDIFADFKYTKVEINEQRELYLTIPEKYEQCN